MTEKVIKKVFYESIVKACNQLSFIESHEKRLTKRGALALKLKHGHIDGIKHSFRSIGQIIKYGDIKTKDIPISGNRAHQIYWKSIMDIDLWLQPYVNIKKEPVQVFNSEN